LATLREFLGTICLIRPDAGTYEDPSEAVVADFEGAGNLIDLSAELWRLVDAEDRAQKIEALLERAYSAKPYGLDDSGIGELLRLTDGLDEALRENVVDQDLRVSADRLPDLRRSTEWLDVDERRSELARHAVGEGLAGVVALRNILKRARAQKLHIVFG